MAATFVLPGDLISAPSPSALALGPGIAFTSSSSHPQLVASRTGFLTSGKGKGKESATSLFIEGRSKRYIPAQRDLVLGTIIARHSEGYRVDIGAAGMASLDALAFEGATKRSKPNLKVGTLVYARVSLANRDMESELECLDPATGKSDGFGELKGGVVVNCSLQLCRQLMTRKHPLLPTLAASTSFETAIGLNGRIWIKSGSISDTIALKRMLENVDDGSLAADQAAVEKAMKAYLA